MERVQRTFKDRIACDVKLAWRSISDEVTVQTARTREKYWSHWNNYCKEYGTEPYLHSVKPCEKSIILTVFTVRVHTGAYIQGDHVQIKSVTDALVAISKTCHMVGEHSVIYQTKGEYNIPIKSLF